MNIACLNSADIAPHYTPITPAWSYTSRSKVARSLEFVKDDWKTVHQELAVTSIFDQKFQQAMDRIRTLCGGQQAHSPNQTARESATLVLERLKPGKVVPQFINATGDESLLFEFVMGEDSFSLDFYNSGEIVFLKRVRGNVLAASEFSQEDIDQPVLDLLTYARANMR